MNHQAFRWLVLKRLGMAALALFAAGIVLLVFERIRGAWAFKKRIIGLVQRGEQLDIAKLEPAHPKPSDDAAAALLLLTNRLNSATTNFHTLLPPWNRFAAPGKTVVSTKLARWSRSWDKGTTNTWASIHTRLAEDPTLTDAIHAALLRPGWNDGFNYHKGFANFQIGPLGIWKYTALHLMASSLAALQEGRVPVAVDRLEDMLRLVRHEANSPLVISELVRISNAFLSWHASWEIVVNGQSDEAQLARLQTAWEGLDFSTNMAHAMEMERAMTLDHFEQMLGSPGYLEKAVKQATSLREMGWSPEWPTRAALLRLVHLPVWRFAWARQDQLRSLNRWQAMIEFDRRARSESWASVRTQVAGVSDEMDWLFDPTGNQQKPRDRWYDRCRFLFSRGAFGVGSMTTRHSLEIETQRRLMIVAIALRRHQLRHGTFPEQLEELRPDLLASVPVDLMDGKPLRYRRLSDGSPLLYSVGYDGQDDGGDARLPEGDQRTPSLWRGRDAVWPAPASVTEAEKVAKE